MTRPDWSDDRLAAAFAARANAVRPMPVDLSAAVVERLATVDEPARGGPWRLRAFVGVVATVALAVVIGASQLGHIGRPSGPSGTPGDTGSPIASQPAAVVFGPPIDVGAAIAIRDSGADDRELLVSGFFARLFVPCPAPIPIDAPPNPTRVDCEESFVWLMKEPESLSTTSGDVTSIHRPTGSAIHPALRMIDDQALAAAMANRSAPLTVTIAGHFDDRRAELCAPPDRRTCADTLVVDRLVAIEGRAQPVATLMVNTRWDPASQVNVTIDPTATAADIDGLVEAADPAATILSRQLRTGDQLAEVEPALAADPTWTRQRLIWIVATVSLVDDRPTPRTFLIVDGTSVVDEITASGVTTIAGSPPSSAPPASAGTDALASLLAHPITVADAIDRRDHRLDDTEIAVRGFGWAPGAILCTLIRPGMPALDQCPAGMTWLAARVPPPAHGNELLQPDGAAFNLLVQPETSYGIGLGTTPTDLISVGHFDDHRATACPADLLMRCRRNFIVDALVDPNAAGGASLGSTNPGIGLSRPPVASLDDVVRAALATVAGGGTPVAAFAVAGAAIASYEPIVTGTPALTSTRAVWVVRSVGLDDAGRTVLFTRLIVDGSPDALVGSVYQPTASGVVKVTALRD